MITIIAEIGINWDGDFNLLEEMMIKAKQAGCDAIKLQAFDRATINGNPETERLLKSSENEDNIEKIDCISKNAEVEWFCTPMYPGAVKMLDPFVRKFKIRELDAIPFSKKNSSELIDSVLDTKKPVIVSSQTPIMIKTTSNIQYLYCIPKYPCKMEEIEFEKLKKFDGFSNHCPDMKAPIKAAKLGSKIIEVHITSSKSRNFLDNNVSFDYNELSTLTKEIRLIEK